MFTGTLTATASTTNPDPSSLELTDAQLSKTAATQGMVLLENHDNTLPIVKSTSPNVALFGVGAYATVKGGTGSGNVNNRYTINARTGLENAGFAVTTSDAYWNAVKSAYDTKYPPTTGGSGFGGAVDYSSVEQPLTAVTVQPTAPTDTAVYVLARNSGEGKDRANAAGDYFLTPTETDDLQRIGQNYKHVIVVLNVGGIVDTNFFNQINASALDPSGGKPLDSMLLMSQAGQESGNALAEVLDGQVDPSGKLTDTWASKYSYYPASATFAGNDGNSLQENYTEGIYVGYRYFDSFYKTITPGGVDPSSAVSYPFGYGLSYTDFQIDAQSVTADTKTVTVKAKVTNVGKTYSGKEVVQTYFSAPQTGIDKPYQELAGYAKTDDLAPGASQVLTITYDTTQMSSYNSATAQYVMDAGDYVIRLGNSSRNSHVAAKIHLASRLVTEQLANEETDETLTGELTSNPANFYTYPTEAAEVAAAPSISLDTTGYVTHNHASAYEQTNTVDSSSPYYAIDGAKISSTTAYVDSAQTNWENTGAPYQPKTGENVSKVTTSPTATLFDVAKGTISIQSFVAGLSVTQLANIVEGATAAGTTTTAVGAAGYTTAKYESLGIPGMTLSDGPAGLRLTQQIATTPKTYQYETAWPIGTLLAQTWDRDLIQQVGNAIGKEMKEVGVTLWLAPGMNIHRDPLNGRNFEYYSEDPLVTGLTSAATTAGVQSNPGVGVTIKHYLANNQETSRSSVNETISERALREIYLRGFEISVKTAQPMAIMTSYNKINGTYASANYDTVTDILRGEWGFKGLVMTDWGGNHGAVATMYAGNDLIEPGGNQGEIINNLKKVDATIDYDGMPAYNKTVSPTRTSYSLTLGGLTLAAPASSSTTIVTNVGPDTDLSQTPLSTVTTTDVINNQTVAPVAVYGTVANAYAQVQATLAALSATQRAAIVVSNVVYQTPGDSTTPVVSYTVTTTGNYAITSYNMRLGDLQRSAINILNIVRQTAGFQQLAAMNGVTGISVGAYTGQFTDLPSVVSDAKTVVKQPVGPAPDVTLAASPAAPASGWYTRPVTFTATAADAQSTYLSIEVDNGEVTDYTGPVTVSGDGTHTVDLFGTSANALPARRTIIVKIDGTAPAASVVSSAKGKLTLAATDAGSGVAAIKYSVNGGSTWATYTGPVTVTGAPKVVQYRAIDKAGNTSAVKSVTVQGVLSLGKPVIKGAPVVGSTLTASVKVTPGATISYQWLRNGKAIAKATKSSYTPVAADATTRLSVAVTAKKANYATATATSAAVTVAGKLALSTPVISGVTAVGHMVTASVATHTAGATLSYQWLRSGRAIAGGTKSTYKIVAADKGKKLSVRVTEKKAGYVTLTSTSAAKSITR
ncbi:glycoside hydrolase family 3 protein [Nakamurella panacisegetis]|nr:glycoside hydrolase family 3 protein [Nakamurella panacisegetis]